MALGAVAVLLAGCASSLHVTYLSDPPGATIRSGSTVYGASPVTVTYQLSESQIKQGQVSVAPATATWVSGATASINLRPINLVSQGYSVHYSFPRPNVPGRDRDVRYAMELERTRLMQRQAAAQERQAAAAEMQADAMKDQAAAARNRDVLAPFSTGFECNSPFAKNKSAC